MKPTESALSGGDVRDIQSLRPLFEDIQDREAVLIHTAGIIDISDQVSPLPMRSMSTEPKTSSLSAGNTGSAVCSTSARSTPSPRVTNPLCSMR